MADELALYKAIFDTAPDGILVVDPGGRIVLANHHLELIFGYRRDELVGQHLELLVPTRLRAGHVHKRNLHTEAPRVRAMGEGQDIYGRRKDGSELPVDISLSPLRAQQGVYTIAMVRDATARVTYEERLRFMGTHDPLTKLYNRAYFETEKARLARGRALPVSVMVMDVDGLKDVNDHLGHAAGDQHLSRLAVVLRGCFRAEDTVARLGGDEFGVLLPMLDEAGLAGAVDRFRGELAQHNEIHGCRPIVVSVGCATALSGSRVSEALRLADMRMYDEKRNKMGARKSVAPR